MGVCVKGSDVKKEQQQQQEEEEEEEEIELLKSSVASLAQSLDAK